MRSVVLAIATLVLAFASCATNLKIEFVESVANYSNYSTVDWKELSEKYYRPNSYDWGDSLEGQIAKGFPMEMAGYYWHILQNARTDFHKKSLSLRAVVSQNVIEAIDRAEAMFDTVFVRCVSQEYYMRLFPEMYNEVMSPAIDELVELLNRQK